MLSRKWTRPLSYHISESILPRPKLFKRWGSQDEFFHEVAKFMLEVGFVTPWFYGMPKKRAGFIIATYEGETFDWGLLSAEALRDQLYGVQQKGKPMKTIFGRWLSVLFPPQSSENRSDERRPSRARRPVQREEWQEAESVQAETRIGTSRNHSTRTRITATGTVTSSAISTKPFTNRTNSRICTYRTNEDITTAATDEAKGSTFSAKEAEGAGTKKKKNEGADHTALFESGISTKSPTQLCTHHNHN